MLHHATETRRARGRANYLSGLAAEDSVERRYTAEGGSVAARRWRGSRGEIDLVIRRGDELIFVEVKKARDFATAAERLGPAQLARICGAAEEFAGGEPLGSLTPMRVDLALVNERGETDIIENVTMH